MITLSPVIVILIIVFIILCVLLIVVVVVAHYSKVMINSIYAGLVGSDSKIIKALAPQVLSYLGLSKWIIDLVTPKIKEVGKQ